MSRSKEEDSAGVPAPDECYPPEDDRKDAHEPPEYEKSWDTGVSSGGAAATAAAFDLNPLLVCFSILCCCCICEACC